MGGRSCGKERRKKNFEFIRVPNSFLSLSLSCSLTPSPSGTEAVLILSLSLELQLNSCPACICRLKQLRLSLPPFLSLPLSFFTFLSLFLRCLLVGHAAACAGQVSELCRAWECLLHMFLLNGPEWNGPRKVVWGRCNWAFQRSRLGIAASPGVTADMHKERARER